MTASSPTRGAGDARTFGYARPIRILGIGGSTREGSKSQVILETALRLADEVGAEGVLADVHSLGFPVFGADLPRADYGPRLEWLLDETRQADGFLLCSPTYHGTISGAVKNALDILDFLGDDDPAYFGGKPVGLMAMGGASATNTVNAMHHAARGLAGLTVPTTVVVPGGAVDVEGRDLNDPAVRRRLAALVGETIDLAGRLRRPAPIATEPWEAVAAQG